MRLFGLPKARNFSLELSPQLASISRVAKNRQVLLLAGILLLALSLRISLFILVNDYYWYGGMSGGFHIGARNLAEGRGFVEGERQSDWVFPLQEEQKQVVPVEDVPVFDGDVYKPITWRVPAYGFLGALSYKIFGTGLVLRGFQIILDSSVVILLFLISRRFLAFKGACLAGFIYAIWPAFARNSIHILPEAFLPFLLALILLLLIRGIDKGTWLEFILAGLVAGVLAYFRSEWLIFPFFIFAAIMLVKRKLLLQSCVFLAISVVLIFPWIGRNYILTGSAVIKSNTGLTLWEGLGEYPNPWGAVGNDVELSKELEAAGLSDPIEVNNIYTRRFLAAIQNDPLFYAWEVARRIPRTLLLKTDWGLTEINVKNPGFQQLKSQGTDIGVLGFFLLNPKIFVLKAGPWFMDSLLFVLALGGAVLLLRREPMAWLLASPIIFMITFYSLTHFEPRFMVPGIFPYCIFASALIISGIGFLKKLPRFASYFGRS